MRCACCVAAAYRGDPSLAFQPAHPDSSYIFLPSQYSSNLYLDNQILLKLKNEFLEHMDVGLATAGPVGPGRRLLMLPSHIARLPDGHESGSVYAIDMGGTNFRVMHIRLSAESGKVRDGIGYRVLIIVVPQQNSFPHAYQAARCIACAT